MMISVLLFFFKQKTAYEMRISDWSSDVCSSDLCDRQRCQRGRGVYAARHGHRYRHRPGLAQRHRPLARGPARPRHRQQGHPGARRLMSTSRRLPEETSRLSANDGTAQIAAALDVASRHPSLAPDVRLLLAQRSDEHTSELQLLKRLSDAVFCLK